MALIFGGIAVGSMLVGAIGSYFLFKKSGKDYNLKSDNEGLINNAIQISESNINNEITWLLRAIVLLLVVKFMYTLYRDHKRSLKKKYLTRFSANQSN